MMAGKTIILSIILFAVALTLTARAQEQTKGTFESGVTWALSEDGTLTLGGNGPLPVSLSAGANNQPWYAVRDRIISVVIEDGVTTLGIGAFQGCTQLASLTIGKGITKLPDSIIQGTALTSLVIPPQITRCEPDTFEGATKLETVHFNAVNCDDFNTIYVGPPFGMGKCPALKSVVVGDTVMRIPDNIFASITTLTSLTIGTGVTEIGRYAFQGCSNLTSIVIPGNVQTIAHSAFDKCTGATSITLENGINHIGITAFTGAKVTELTIPESLSEIRNGAFGNFSRLETVYFNAKNCENIDVDSPFDKCEILSSIVFDDNVRRVPQYIAKNLEGLESVTFGRRVTQLGNYAFSGCANLTEVINNSARPQKWGWGLFDAVDKSYCTVHVPESALKAYQSDDKWKDFTIEAQ